MVEIAPFKGVIYNPLEISGHGGLLTAPPYDVLNDQERQAHHLRHPHNILHIDFGPRLSDDPEPYTWHQRSAVILDQWLKDGVLERLEKPAFFQMETDCLHPETGQTVTRHGQVCLMRLEEFSKLSKVRPHEKTFSSHKKERLSLMQNTKAHLSQVFGFFPDETSCAINLMSEVKKKSQPNFDFTDQQDFRHKVWINDDEKLVDQFVKCLSDQTVYIADGHHRYETALNYRRQILEGRQVESDSSLNYLMIYLCPMSDPGLIILPTHRLLNHFSQSTAELLKELALYFDVKPLSLKTGNGQKAEAHLAEELDLAKHKGHNAFGLYLDDAESCYLLTLKAEAKKHPALSQARPELAQLDTYILTHLLFMEAMKLTEDDLDDPHLISYESRLDKALKQVDDKKQRAAFVINPTSVQEILDVAEAGLVMPRKSTFFYPKVTTGLVLNLINPDERV